MDYFHKLYNVKLASISDKWQQTSVYQRLTFCTANEFN